VDSQYAQTTPLALQTSLGNVESTPGSIYSNGTLVYVHLQDSSNPNNHVIEVSGSRAYGVELGGLSSVTIDGLEIVRAAKSGIVAGSNVVGATNVIQNNVIFNTGDSLGDNANQGYGAGNAEGSIFAFVAFGASAPTGWQIIGNWIGQDDFPDSSLNTTLSGIMTFGLGGQIVKGNKVATVHGSAMQISDSNSTVCTSPDVENNEVVNSEGNLNFEGCQSDIIVSNQVHDSFGNGIEIGGGNDGSDVSNNAPYIAGNTIHDMAPAYANGQYNGIDVNHATNGIATANTIYRVANDGMTLEADSGASSGWQVYGNTLDASSNTFDNGTACTSSNRCFAIYVRDTSLSGGLTMRSNTLVGNSGTGYLTRFGATSSGDTTHDLTQLIFDQSYPNYETPGTPIIYSAAGTAVPTCTTALKGLQLTVSDATTPTYLGTYTSGGAVVAPVVCTGSAWQTH
jgi:hypothetical protein